jgi:hypothetical protein
MAQIVLLGLITSFQMTCSIRNKKNPLFLESRVSVDGPCYPRIGVKGLILLCQLQFNKFSITIYNRNLQ